VRLGRAFRDHLAVDLGTANTVVFRRGEGIVLFEPSVVAIDEVTGKVQAVGEQARRMIGRTPASIRATRPLRHGVIADFEMTEQMLRYFIGATARAGAEVIVCVPSGVTQVERNAVEEATRAAGARRAYLIEEPLAGAIGAGLPVGEAIGSMVVDIGGGTSEIAVTALGGMVVAQSLRVGGYELDEAIVRYLQQTTKLLVGEEQAEVLKLEIATAFPVGVADKIADVAGRDLLTGLLRRAPVGASEVRRAIDAPLRRIIDAVREVLERTPPELLSDVSDRGIMLVGGGALLAGIDELLRQETGVPVTIAEDPLLTVARGAGKALEEIDALARTSKRERRRSSRRA
jgi:rod shape-determining protein MreB